MPDNPFYRSSFWRSLRAQRLALDGHTCTVPGCGAVATIVEHTITRPPTAAPCSLDRLDLLRSLCRLHDNQTKELRAGQQQRASGGRHTVPGCSADGTPIDPSHRWNAPRKA